MSGLGYRSLSVPPAVSKRSLLLLTVVAVALAAVGIAVLVAGGNDSSDDTTQTGTPFVTVSRTSDIAILDLATGRTRVLTDARGKYLAVSSPTWSPDGRQIAFARQVCAHCPFRLVVAATKGGAAVPVRGWRKNGQEPAWSWDGSRLVFTTNENGDRELVLLDLARARSRALVLHEEESEGAGEEEVEHPNHPTFSPDERTIAFEAETAREQTRIFLLDQASGELHEVESEADHHGFPAFAPDGRGLAFSRTDARFVWNVCVALLDRDDETTCLTHGPANETEPTWSPDGRSIVFAGDRDDPQHVIRSLYLVRPDGSGLRRLTRGFDDGAPAYSPSGTEIAFVRRRVVKISG